MRLTATSITIFSLLLAACDMQPPFDMKKELNTLSGPKPDGMNDALKGQAEQAVASKDYSRAAQTYRQLTDRDPANREYALGLADSLRRAGDNQNALKVLDKFIATNGPDATAYETRGLCLMSLGSFTDAGKSFEEVMKLEQNRWRTLNAIGILFTMKNKFPEAIAYYDEALTHSGDNASVLNNRGITLAMDKKYDAAIESFLRTRKNLRAGSTDMQQIDMNLALVYAIMGNLEEAERTATPYLSKQALYNNMGVYAELAKNTDLARSYLNMALTQSPVYYERAWKNLGTVGENTTPVTNDLGAPKEVKKSAVKVKKAEKKAAIPDESQGISLNQIPQPDSGDTPAPPALLPVPAPVQPQLQTIQP